ncbi:hypothetical protein EVB91_083 [Rhizobium phage RHph_I1_18]|nr:hypothetical protein EVB91_083 [Rhizobium phage RHph_I1_18]
MSDIFQVLIKGRPVDVYEHKSQLFIEGRKGSEYTIRIKNPLYKRVKAVISVDGISVLDGKLASKDSLGYIINSRGTIDVDGWRVSNSAVRAFQFADVDQSYSSKSGNGDANVGVLAVRLYEEELPAMKPRTPMFYGYDNIWGAGTADASKGIMQPTYSTCRSAMGAIGFNSTADTGVGTGQGQQLTSEVKTVQFKSHSYHSAQQVVYYDTIKGLEQRGVVITRKNHVPNPFPGDTGFCKSF